MATIHELLKHVSDEKLRAALEKEVQRLSRQKKFGLVFEEHLPRRRRFTASDPRGDCGRRPRTGRWALRFVKETANKDTNCDLQSEYEDLKSQIVISSWGGNCYLPTVFTDDGAAMLSGADVAR